MIEDFPFPLLKTQAERDAVREFARGHRWDGVESLKMTYAHDPEAAAIFAETLAALYARKTQMQTT